VGNYCYVASARRRARHWGAHGGRRGAGHIVSPRAQLVVCYLCVLSVGCSCEVASSSVPEMTCNVLIETLLTYL